MVRSKSILAVVITVVNIIAVPHFPGDCSRDTMSRSPLTHPMELELSLQPFRASRTECMRHDEGFFFVCLFFLKHNDC